MEEVQTFAENVFVVDGPPVHAVGITFPTRMIIVKLGDNSLWVNSPVSVSPKTLDRIGALGVVQHLVAPTKLHVWRLAAWHELFPHASMWAPPQVPHEFKSWPYTGTLGDNPLSLRAGFENHRIRPKVADECLTSTTYDGNRPKRPL